MSYFIQPVKCRIVAHHHGSGINSWSYPTMHNETDEDGLMCIIRVLGKLGLMEIKYD